MPQVTTSLTLSISGSQNVTVSSGVIDAEAIGHVDVAVAADDSTTTAEIQPSNANQIHALMISSSYYGPALTYAFSDGTNDSTGLTLNGPQLFSGGSVESIGVNPTQIKLTMTNAGEDATVNIVVARDATS